MILTLVCAAQFMLILDLVVVNVALPTMQKDLRLSPSDLQWVVITYGLTFGGFLLLGGRAADLLGRRNMLVAGLAMFTTGSLAAGLAGSLIPLLVARTVQGLGAAMAAPLSGSRSSPPQRSLAQQRSRVPSASRPPSALSPRPQASSAARLWPPDSALLLRSPPGSCSGEPNGPRHRLACRNQHPSRR